MTKVRHSRRGIPGKDGHLREDWMSWHVLERDGSSQGRKGWEGRTKSSCDGLLLPGHGDLLRVFCRTT